MSEKKEAKETARMSSLRNEIIKATKANNAEEDIKY